MTLWTVAPTSCGYGSPRFTTFKTQTADVFFQGTSVRAPCPHLTQPFATAEHWGSGGDMVGGTRWPQAPPPQPTLQPLARGAPRAPPALPAEVPSCPAKPTAKLLYRGICCSSLPWQRRNSSIFSYRYDYVLVTALIFFKWLDFTAVTDRGLCPLVQPCKDATFIPPGKGLLILPRGEKTPLSPGFELASLWDHKSSHMEPDHRST